MNPKALNDDLLSKVDDSINERDKQLLSNQQSGRHIANNVLCTPY